MVYYYTSANVKVIRNILCNYKVTEDISPYEYIKNYIEKYPEETDDSKLAWTAETFLSLQKHEAFLRDMSSNVTQEISEEERDYFEIILHAVTFQINAKTMDLLYKCLFNLSRPLLKVFTNFLSNNEVLCFISQVAQLRYDINFISEKIICPLFEWQPYISEMGYKYAEYEKKIERRNTRVPVIPQHPNVLNRSKGKVNNLSEPALPLAPPNSMTYEKNRKMLTKSAIDKRLKRMYEKNKQKALHLLKNVKNNNIPYTQVKTEDYYKKILSIKEANEFCTKPFPKPKFDRKSKSNLPIVKETVATIKRFNKRIQLTEEEEVQWLLDVINNCKNTSKVQELVQYERQERERERLIEVEKKHLLGQISYEDAILAKKKHYDYNKSKYEDFVKEKETWYEEIEKWKKNEIEKNRKQFERLSLAELNAIEAKNDCVLKRKEVAEALKKESEILLANSHKIKQEELEFKINMIKEIKILAMIAKKAKIPKIIDLTETSGIGSLCEMSLAELRERINTMKMKLKEELESKRESIRQQNMSSKLELEAAKDNIKTFMAERAILRKQNQKLNLNTITNTPKEIDDLKKTLKEKRKMRFDIMKADCLI